MDLSKSGLILEGGGLRGVYTSGVLRFLMEKDIYFPYVIGVSMGACNAANYVSRQIERNRTVNISFVKDSRYLSYKRLMTKGELFGMDFIFNTIPNKLVPFDHKTFNESTQKLITTVTDCYTGEALYYEKSELGDNYLKVLQASCSLPFAAHPVYYDGKYLMDGGISDSIPIKKSIADGNQKHILILTQPKGYRKNKSKLNKLVSLRYPHHPGIRRALKNRSQYYNETMDFIDRLEEKGKVFVIRPVNSLNLSRAERDQEKLYSADNLGYLDAEKSYGQLLNYLS